MKRLNRSLIWVLALLLAIEPVVIPIHRAFAESISVASLNMKTEEVDLTRLVKPMKLVRDGLITRNGLTRDQVFARAWANYAIMMSQVSLFYGRECKEAITLERALSPDTIKTIMDHKELVTCAPKFIQLAASSLGAMGKLLPITFKELDDGYEAVNWALSLQKHLVEYKNVIKEGIESNKILSKLDAVAAPAEHTGFNGQKLFSAFTASKEGALVTPTQMAGGAMRSALFVLSACMLYKDGAEFVDNLEFNTGFENLLAGLGLLADFAGLFGFLLPPPVGEIVGAIQIILLVAKDMIALYKDWLDTKELAYQDSYRFLMDCDPNFKSYSDNDALWPDIIKADSLKLLETKYKDYKTTDYTAGGSSEVPFKRGIEAAMNQGKVLTWYNRGHASPLAVPLENMKQLWEDKMDYMKWKPTQKDSDEAEDAKRAPTWQKVLTGIWHATPIYIAYKGIKTGATAVGNWWNKDNIKDTCPRVWYNPDFYLYQQIKRYTDSKNPGMEKFLKYRMETAPYHLIPLVEIPVETWGDFVDDGPVGDAMRCDTYLCSLKSLRSMKLLFKGLCSSLKEKTSSLKDHLESLRDNLIDDWAKPSLEALNELGKAYKKDPEKPVSDDLWSKLQSSFDLDALPDGTEKTPKAIVQANRLVLQNYLNLFPYILGNLQAEALIAVDSTLSYYLIYKIFTRQISAKIKEETEKLYSSIKNEGFKKFLDKKEYLHFKEGFFFSQPNIPKKLMDEVVKDLADPEGETMKAFKESILNLTLADDYDYHTTIRSEIMWRFRGALKFFQTEAFKAAQLWKGIASQTGVQVKVPTTGTWSYSNNDASYQWIETSDDATREIFMADGFTGTLFKIPCSLKMSDPETEAGLMRAIHEQMAKDQTPEDLFKKMTP